MRFLSFEFYIRFEFHHTLYNTKLGSILDSDPGIRTLEHLQGNSNYSNGLKVIALKPFVARYGRKLARYSDCKLYKAGSRWYLLRWKALLDRSKWPSDEHLRNHLRYRQIARQSTYLEVTAQQFSYRAHLVNVESAHHREKDSWNAVDFLPHSTILSSSSGSFMSHLDRRQQNIVYYGLLRRPVHE